MATNYELSIAIPAYNERENLPSLIREYRKAKKDVRFQLVIVDNGSSDGTAEFLKRVVKKKGNSFIKAVTVKKNIGYGYGILQGLLSCDADVIGWSHADMQCPPEDVFRGYKLYMKQAGNVLVKGHRVGRSWKHRVFTYGLQHFASTVLLRWFDDINGQPKIFNRKLLETFRNPPLKFSFDLYVQYKAKQVGYKVVPFTVNYLRRVHGESKGGDVSIRKKIPLVKQFVIDVAKMRIRKIR